MNYYEKLRNRAKSLKNMYPAGTRVECISMTDPYAPVPPGTRGTVIDVDDIATIHVDWDNGSGLGLVSGEDRFRKLTQEEVEAEQKIADEPTDNNDFEMSM